MMEQEIVRREFVLDTTACREKDRTVPASLSSTYPVPRSYGQEVLQHDPAAVDLSRAPLPLLESHRTDQLPIGAVDSLTIQNGRLRGLLRFGTSSRALEVWNDVKAGILRNLSISYSIIRGHKVGEQYVVDRWMPLEVSMVSVPADPTVGVGRSLPITTSKGFEPMETQDMQWTAEEKAERKAKAARGLEISEIWAIAEKFNAEDLARRAIREQWSVETMKERVMLSRGVESLNVAATLAMAAFYFCELPSPA